MVVAKVITRRRAAAWPRRLMLSALVLLLLLAAACTGLSVYVGWQLSHPKKLALSGSPADLNLSFENVSFKSRSGDVKLKGWFLPAASPNPAGTVIFAHGYTKNRLQDDLPALPLAASVVKAGYQVVMFDFRNSGESGGSLTSVGQFETNDLLGAIDWVKSAHPGPVILHGFSMGASTALMAAAEEPAVLGVVADSPFNHLGRYLRDNLPAWSHLPSFPFTPLIMSLLPPLTGIQPDSVDDLAAVDRIYPRPVLFIHSADDDKIPYTQSEAMWNKHPDKFEFWKTSGAGHVGSYKLDPNGYAARSIAFYQKLK